MPNYRSPGVYIEELESGSRPIEGVGTAIAAFVGVAADGPVNRPTKVTNWTQYQKHFGDFVPGAYMPLAVYSFFNNGGGSAYIVRIGANGDGDGSSALPAAQGELVSAAKGDLATYRISALEPGAAGNDLSVEITAEPGEGDEPSESFTLSVKKGGKQAERFEGLVSRKGNQELKAVVNAQSTLISIADIGSASVADKVPAAGEISLAGGSSASVPERVSSDEFVGDASRRTGLGALEAIDDVTMVAMPDVMAAYKQEMLDLDQVKAIQLEIIAHCEKMQNRIAILDTPHALDAQGVLDWRMEKAGYDSKFATMYWPWVKMVDPGTGEIDFVPPSGAVAGLWGKTDDTRGVHKAPANDVLQGVLEVQLNVTTKEHDDLNPVGINVIRSFPGRGVRVWGARTLSSDPAWRYLNVRRLFNFMEDSILAGTQWVVFEPNDLDLWQRITRTIRGFLLGLWREGALFGATPDEAFYVKCDAETNPPEDVDAGRVTVEIGVCPVKPAEFVVFKLAQLPTGGADIAE